MNETNLSPDTLIKYAAFSPDFKDHLILHFHDLNSPEKFRGSIFLLRLQVAISTINFTVMNFLIDQSQLTQNNIYLIKARQFKMDQSL